MSKEVKYIIIDGEKIKVLPEGLKGNGDYIDTNNESSGWKKRKKGKTRYSFKARRRH